MAGQEIRGAVKSDRGEDQGSSPLKHRAGGGGSWKILLEAGAGAGLLSPEGDRPTDLGQYLLESLAFCGQFHRTDALGGSGRFAGDSHL